MYIFLEKNDMKKNRIKQNMQNVEIWGRLDFLSIDMIKVVCGLN